MEFTTSYRLIHISIPQTLTARYYSLSYSCQLLEDCSDCWHFQIICQLFEYSSDSCCWQEQQFFWKSAGKCVSNFSADFTTLQQHILFLILKRTAWNFSANFQNCLNFLSRFKKFNSRIFSRFWMSFQWVFSRYMEVNTQNTTKEYTNKEYAGSF